MEAQDVSNSGPIFSLKYHFVWCSKYLRPILVAPLDARLKELIREATDLRSMQLHALEVQPDHVRLIIEADPRWAPAAIVGKIKAKTSRVLRDEFPTLRSRVSTPWSSSYFCAAVGNVEEATIQHYIAAQKYR